MNTLHALRLFTLTLFSVLLGSISPSEAISIDYSTETNAKGFTCTFEFNYVPAKEDIGGIQIDVKTVQNLVPTDIIASAPEQGPWSQLSPVLIRKDPAVSLSAITPSFLKSMLNDPVTIFSVQFTYSGTPPSDARKLIDTIVVKNAVSTSGKTNNVAVGWGATSIKTRKAAPQPECSYIAKSQRIHQLMFSLKNDCTVNARIINANGKTVKILLNSKMPSGIHTVAWDGTSGKNTRAASGIYFIQLETGSFTYNKKVSHLK